MRIATERYSFCRRYCVVSIPARTSVSVLDMNYFGLGRAGGGNVGFAFNSNTVIRIEVIRHTDCFPVVNCAWADHRSSLIFHVVKTWCDLNQEYAEYNIDVLRANKEHIGFASSAAIQTATWAALNWLHGNPYSDYQLRHIIAQHYREAYENNVTKGFTTGLSSFIGMYGGFAVVGEDVNPILHKRIPSWTAAMVTPSNTNSISFGEVEIKTLTQRVPLLDSKAKQNKFSVIYENLSSAVEKSDLTQTGKAIEKIQMTGSKLAEIDIYGLEIHESLRELRSTFECAFMSAVGPGIAILTTQDEELVSSKVARHGYNVEWLGKTNNTGIQVYSDKRIPS